MAASQHIIDNLGTITKVPNRILTELVNLTNLCIGSAISDAKLQEQTTLSLNIGIGTLGIDLVNMGCKFVPSKELKQAIRTALEDNTDPLAVQIDQAMVDKLISICEEVI